MISRDGHIRVLPLHVANKIAAGEVVERPASVVKELVENAIDAGSKNIRISISQGGRKLVSVQDDGCGMSRDDAVLSLERQATSKILDVNDIEEIDTLGFRGEAIPSIASVSRFTITTRQKDHDEGTLIQVNAGQLAEVRSAGCPPGTLVEVRDLFCNVPARRKFLRAYVTEEAHIKNIFTVHALAHPNIAFSLVIDGRETYRLAPAASLSDRILEIFGEDFVSKLLPIKNDEDENVKIRVTGFIEKPNLNEPTRRDQYIFINGRPASATSIAYALREAYPKKQGDTKPAAILLIDLPPSQVDVNVHPTKREVRFRDNVAIRQAIIGAVESALGRVACPQATDSNDTLGRVACPQAADSNDMFGRVACPQAADSNDMFGRVACPQATENGRQGLKSLPVSAPIQVEFAIEPNSTASKPWQWFIYLAQTSTGFLLIETDAGIVTINPQAARERINYEAIFYNSSIVSQNLLIPEIAHFSPVDATRIRVAMPAILSMGFQVEEFGKDTFKIDAIPQLIEGLGPVGILSTIAKDFADSSSSHRGSERWREEVVARAVAKSSARMSLALTEHTAVQLVQELCACRMPYVSPRGKPILIFTSTRELNRKFATE